MRIRLVAFLIVIVAGTESLGQKAALNGLDAYEITDVRDIRDVVTAHCPAEWDAVVAWKAEPNNWTESTGVGVHPALDQSVTLAHHKYTASIISLTEHVASMVKLWDAVEYTPSHFDQAKTEYALARCLMLSPAEQALVAEIPQRVNPSMSDEDAISIMFKMYTELKCTGFTRLVTETLLLDPDSPTFAKDQAEIMSSTTNTCAR